MAPEHISARFSVLSLWKSFESLPHEMTLSKGYPKRMQPLLKLNIEGLKPEKYYSMKICFRRLDDRICVYNEEQMNWGLSPGNDSNKDQDSKEVSHMFEMHLGKAWMRIPFDFKQIRLIGCSNWDGPSYVHLEKARKYKVYLNVYEYLSNQHQALLVTQIPIEFTEFITMYNYRNKTIENLNTKQRNWKKVGSNDQETKRKRTPSNDLRQHGKPMNIQALSSSVKNVQSPTKPSSPGYIGLITAPSAPSSSSSIVPNDTSSVQQTPRMSPSASPRTNFSSPMTDSVSVTSPSSNLPYSIGSVLFNYRPTFNYVSSPTPVTSTPSPPTQMIPNVNIQTSQNVVFNSMFANNAIALPFYPPMLPPVSTLPITFPFISSIVPLQPMAFPVDGQITPFVPNMLIPFNMYWSNVLPPLHPLLPYQISTNPPQL